MTQRLKNMLSNGLTPLQGNDFPPVAPGHMAHSHKTEENKTLWKTYLNIFGDVWNSTLCSS